MFGESSANMFIFIFSFIWCFFVVFSFSLCGMWKQHIWFLFTLRWNISFLAFCYIWRWSHCITLRILHGQKRIHRHNINGITDLMVILECMCAWCVFFAKSPKFTFFFGVLVFSCFFLQFDDTFFKAMHIQNKTCWPHLGNLSIIIIFCCSECEFILFLSFLFICLCFRFLLKRHTRLVESIW